MLLKCRKTCKLCEVAQKGKPMQKEKPMQKGKPTQKGKPARRPRVPKKH
jgi:hypothetical protein